MHLKKCHIIILLFQKILAFISNVSVRYATENETQTKESGMNDSFQSQEWLLLHVEPLSFGNDDVSETLSDLKVWVIRHPCLPPSPHPPP